jgi:hypothetical protein
LYLELFGQEGQLGDRRKWDPAQLSDVRNCSVEDPSVEKQPAKSSRQIATDGRLASGSRPVDRDDLAPRFTLDVIEQSQPPP